MKGLWLKSVRGGNLYVASIHSSDLGKIVAFFVLYRYLCAASYSIFFFTFYTYIFPVCPFVVVIARYRSSGEKRCFCTFGLAFSEAAKEK